MKAIILLIPLTVMAHPFEPPLPGIGSMHWCQIHWLAPTEHENGAPILPTEGLGYDLEFRLDGEWIKPYGKTDRLHKAYQMQHDIPCPDCEDIRVRANIANGQTSIWVDACSLNPPVMCQ